MPGNCYVTREQHLGDTVKLKAQREPGNAERRAISETRSGKVGVTGFCMGGALTLLALCMTPEIDAAVVW